MPRLHRPSRPIIGITTDMDGEHYRVSRAYSDAVIDAGGMPVILPATASLAETCVSMCDGIVLTGGDDPIMEQWGVPTHPQARKVNDARQAFELALLDALERRSHVPVLGICLGMQYMALHAGAGLDQHLPDTLPTHALHVGKVVHEVDGEFGRGPVFSNHRQAVIAAQESSRLGPDHIAPHLRVIARAPDGIIEAIRRDDRPFCIGVQWHPERTDDRRLGRDLFAQLVASCDDGGRPSIASPRYDRLSP